MVAAYAGIFAVAAVYKLHIFRMGFDLGVHEQVLWNTMHGRIAAVSPFGTTDSYLGIDIIIVELLLTPLYALYPRTETMLVMQAVLASTGAVPLFLLARERTGLAIYGLLAAFLYFATLAVQYAILYEFQIRTVGTVLFLWAFLYFERKRFWLFLLFGVLAIWTRSEAGFVLAAIGLYALLHRRSWPWVAAPVVVGLGWVALCVQILIPSFRAEHDFLYSLIYTWMGDTPLEMIRTLLFRPGYVAEHVLTPEKLAYLLDLFAPLLLLPLLRPDILLIAAPALLLNLLSLDRIHWSVHYHYQAFIVPFLLIATIYAITDRRADAAQHSDPERQRSFRVPLVQHWSIAVLLVVAALAAQLLVRSPLISLATAQPDERYLTTAHEMMALVPDDAPLSVTSLLGPHMARREGYYFFPGNVIYPPELAERGDYLLADLHDLPAPEDDLAHLRRLQQSDEWRKVAEQDGFLLLARVEQ
jgi:uncharacterized membrane protein